SYPARRNASFTAVRFTEGGAEGFSVTPASGVLSDQGAMRLKIQANLGGPPARLRNGTLRILFDDRAAPGLGGVPIARAAGECTPTYLIPVFTSVAPGFTAAAGDWIDARVKVVDDCGSPAPQQASAATITSGATALQMTPVEDGIWAASLGAKAQPDGAL